MFNKKSYYFALVLCHLFLFTFVLSVLQVLLKHLPSTIPIKYHPYFNFLIYLFFSRIFNCSLCSCTRGSAAFYRPCIHSTVRHTLHKFGVEIVMRTTVWSSSKSRGHVMQNSSRTETTMADRSPVMKFSLSVTLKNGKKNCFAL